MKRKVLSLLLAVVLAFSAMFVPQTVFAAENRDTAPPTVYVDSLSVSNNYVISGDIIKISVGITDFSGIEEAYLFYEMPVSKELVYMPLLRNKDTGKYAIEFYIDNYTECGEWKALYIAAADKEGNKVIIGNSDDADIIADLSAGDFNVYNIFPKGEEPHDFKLFTNETLPLALKSDNFIEWSVSDESVAKLTDITFDYEIIGTNMNSVGTCTVVPLKKGIVDVYAKDREGNIHAVVRVLITAPESSYDVYFDAKGGEPEFDYIEVPYGYYIEMPYMCSRDGYTFLGWSRNPNATTYELRENAEFAPTSDTKFYAVWRKDVYFTAPEICEIKFDYNDGVTETKKEEYKYGTNVTLPTPERDGYICLGWSINKFDIIPDYKCGGRYTPTNHEKLYAVWMRDYSEDECDYVLELHETGKIPIDLPFKASYNIVQKDETIKTKWDVSLYGTQGKYNSYGSVKITPVKPGITEIIVFDEYGYIAESYRVLVKESSVFYTMSFDANGGEIDPDVIQVRHGDFFLFPEATREGYVFKGWSREKGSDKAEFYKNTQMTPKTDFTFYAVWEVAPPPEIFDTTLGDVNSDNKINSTDALMILQHAVGKSLLSGTSLTSADVNKDSKVNSTDALKILQFSVGKIPSM